MILVAVALELMLYARLLLGGGRAIRSDDAIQDSPGGWPAAAMVVPVAGVTPSTRDALRSLLAQDYPDYEVVFSLQDDADPAAPLAEKLIRGVSRGQLVLAGKTASCSQKNRNILAGLKAVRTTPEVLVLCDSTRLAPSGFLRALVAPIARGEARVTSGYHHVAFEGSGILGPARAVTVLILYLTKTVRSMNQPWGGAMAIRRELFEELGVGEIWGSTVVDDVTLAGRLTEAGIPTVLSRGACLSTPVVHDSVSAYIHWLDRQWLYLKFVFPLQWLFAGINQHILAVLSIVSPAAGIAFAAGGASPIQGISAIVFLAGVLCFGLALRRLHPRPGNRARWLAAIFLAIWMSSWSHMRTLFARTVDWKGVRYRVGRGGRVTGISRMGS